MNNIKNSNNYYLFEVANINGCEPVLYSFPVLYTVHIRKM